LLGVLLTQTVQRHKGVNILIELGGHAGDPILQTDRRLRPAQLAPQLMTILAAQARQIRLPIRRQQGGGAGLDLLDLDCQTMLHQAIVEERRSGRVLGQIVQAEFPRLTAVCHQGLHESAAHLLLLRWHQQLSLSRLNHR
jgi:hypothetical protein